MNEEQIVSLINDYLHKAAKLLANWLNNMLPRSGDEWWEFFRLCGNYIINQRNHTDSSPFPVPALGRQDLLHRHGQDTRQRDQVLNGGKGFPSLPLIDGLRRGEAEQSLQLPDGKPALRPERSNVLSGQFHINQRYKHREIPLLSCATSANTKTRNPPVRDGTGGQQEQNAPDLFREPDTPR